MKNNLFKLVLLFIIFSVNLSIINAQFVEIERNTVDGVNATAQLYLKEEDSGQAKIHFHNDSTRLNPNNYFEIAADPSNLGEFYINYRDFESEEIPFYEILCIETNTNISTTEPQVGINTINPTRTLDVNGNARIRDLPQTGLPYNQVVVRSDGVLYEFVGSSANVQNEQLQVRITSLEEKVAKLEALLAYKVSGKNRFNDVSLPNENSYLQQNAPNPFSSITTIDYLLPEEIPKASLQIMDFTGVVVKTILIEGSGSGTITLENADLVAGTYTYSLIANGKYLATQKMVVSN